MKKVLRVETCVKWRGWLTSAVAGIAVLCVVATGPSASGTGDYGPNTCLQVYVWRGAFPGDVVCVTGATRSQAAYDNSQAAVRRNPKGGSYGPDTCIEGYVWREASTTDHVCVTPSTRAQAASDNKQARARRDSLRISLSTYTIPPVCVGDTCTITSTDNVPRFRLNVDHINAAMAKAVLRRISDGRILHSWTVNAAPLETAPGGRIRLKTGVFKCPGVPDSYFQVFDSVSTRWSSRTYVSSQCSVL
jgi:hypothetical protein